MFAGYAFMDDDEGTGDSESRVDCYPIAADPVPGHD
jgi:hypothetical protein